MFARTFVRLHRIGLLQMTLLKGEKRQQENVSCDTCGIEVNSPQMMEAHIRGQKHIKKMKLKAVDDIYEHSHLTFSYETI
jgi:hypothetical protein